MINSTAADRGGIAVLGLGIIGGIWARHLAGEGKLAAAWNRTPKPEFPQWVDDPLDAVARARVIVVVLSDPPAVAALFDRVGAGLGPDHLVIQSTTIDPISSTRFEEQIKATGARYLEAPFTGSKPAAEARKVVYYLGGDAEAMETAEPILALISEARLRIGSCAQAATLKLAMNLQIALQAGALCESLTLARKAGVSDDVFFGALRKNAAWSGLTALKEPKLREGEFSPQFSVKHMLKDMRLLLGVKGAGELSLARGIEDLLSQTAAGGAADEDFVAMIKLIGKASPEL